MIVGFGLSDPKSCTIFDYGDDISGEPVRIAAKQINPYLVDAPTVLIHKRRKPLCPDAPEMSNGGKPTEGGNLLLSPAEADAIRHSDPVAAKYIRPFLGADEFINNLPRYCLWLADSTAQDRKLPGNTAPDASGCGHASGQPKSAYPKISGNSLPLWRNSPDGKCLLGNTRSIFRAKALPSCRILIRCDCKQ